MLGTICNADSAHAGDLRCEWSAKSTSIFTVIVPSSKPAREMDKFCSLSGSFRFSPLFPGLWTTKTEMPAVPDVPAAGAAPDVPKVVLKTGEAPDTSSHSTSTRSSCSSGEVKRDEQGGQATLDEVESPSDSILARLESPSDSILARLESPSDSILARLGTRFSRAQGLGTKQITVLTDRTSVLTDNNLRSNNAVVGSAPGAPPTMPSSGGSSSSNPPMGLG